MFLKKFMMKNRKINLQFQLNLFIMNFFCPTSMRYVNVVAVSDNDDVTILDTNNSLYYYSKDDFEDLMDCRSYIPHNIFLNNYNLIRFEPSPEDHLVTRIVKICKEMSYWGE